VLSLPCLSIRTVESSLLKLLIADLNLGKGEADAIALASQTGLRVILDDSSIFDQINQRNWFENQTFRRLEGC